MTLKDRFSLQTREMFRLLFVLAASVFAASLVTYFFVHYYTPSGRYKVEAVVLEPNTLKTLDLHEEGRQGKKERYLFDRIIFKDLSDRSTLVDLDKYEAFLHLLNGDRSQLNNEEPLFKRGQYMQVLVILHSSGQQSSSKIFQVIEIGKDDYRVNLQEELNGQWAVFHHPGIGDAVINLFIPKKTER